MVPPEPYLRAYLAGLAASRQSTPEQALTPKNLFDSWDDYLAALGMPDYRIDLPRATQANTLMVATLGAAR